MNQCTICKSTDISVQNKLYICNSCKHGYRIYDGNIIEFHKTDYRNAHRRNWEEFSQNKVTKIFHQSRRKIVENRLKAIDKYITKSDNILDIGSGAATFANHIKSLVKNIDCLEIHKRLIEESRRLGFQTFEQDFMKQDFTSKYDVVFAWHVLEHIDDVHAFVRKCKNICNKYIILEVPTKRKPSKVFEGHLHYFTEKSLQVLCESCGLQTISIVQGVQKPAALAIFKTETRDE